MRYRSGHESLLNKLLERFLLNDGFLDGGVGAEEGVVDLGGWDVVAEGGVEDVLRGGVLLDGLDVRGDGDVEVGQLDGDGRQRLDHLRLVLRQSSRVLQVGQSLLDDLLHLVLGDEAQVLRAGDGDYLAVALGVLVLAEADEGAGLGVDALDGLAALADDQPNQPHWDFQLDLVGAVDGAAVHLALRLHDEVQLLPHPLHRLGVALHEDVTRLGARSTRGGHLHLHRSRLLRDVLDGVALLPDHQPHALVGHLENVGVFRGRAVGRGEGEVEVALRLADALLVGAHLVLFNAVQRVIIREDNSFDLRTGFGNLSLAVPQHEHVQVLLVLVIPSLVLTALATHQDLASGLLLELLLVVSLGPDEQTCIVEVTVLGQDDLTLDLGGVVHHGKDAGVETHGEVGRSLHERHADSQVLVGRVELLHEGQVLHLVLGAVETLVQLGLEFSRLVHGDVLGPLVGPF
jgi:hypothetical protein